MEAEQEKVGVSATEKSLSDVICWGSFPSPAHEAGSLSRCFGWHSSHFNIGSILRGRIGPSGIAVFLTEREKSLPENKKIKSEKWIGKMEGKE